MDGGIAHRCQYTALLTSPARIPATRGDPRFNEELHDWILDLLGRFAIIVVNPTKRLYVDAAASVPVLFLPRLELAASSPFLLTDDSGEYRRSEMADVLDIATTNRWFLLGTSPLSGAERLLPNHTLDLTTWSAHRHWPTQPLDRIDVSTGLEAIGNVLGDVMTAVSRWGEPHVGLTAGYDSRAILACSAPVVDRLRFFTLNWPDDYGKVDMGTAPTLAREVGLDYRVLEWRSPTAVDVENWIVQTGCLVGEERGRLTGPTWAQLGRAGPCVLGTGGETIAGAGHGYGWRVGDRPGMELGGVELLERYGFPLHPVLVERVNCWLAGLPRLEAFDLLQLFQLEMRFGCWGGALTTAYPESPTTMLYPYGQRRLIHAAFKLPPEYRQQGTVRQDITAARWPELLEFDFNRPTAGLVARRTVERYARNVLRRPRHGARYVFRRIRR